MTPTMRALDALSPAAIDPAEAERILHGLAAVFGQPAAAAGGPEVPSLEAMYRTLVEQIPAVVFMAYLDRGIGEAYVSPRIEQSLGFTREEWLEDPIRWYSQIHPDDQQRWSIDAAEMFSTGKPLRSAYRVLARDGRVIWFHCEAKMIPGEDGHPWLIHGVGFDITDLKLAEQALADERNQLSALLDTVGALVLVLSADGRVLRFNRECEKISGYRFAEVRGKRFASLFLVPQEAARFRTILRSLRAGKTVEAYESDWITRDGSRQRIAWSSTVLPSHGSDPAYVMTSGIDVTERKRMERAILDISAREQNQIGQDLHDGLGQHLTGIAFMSKVLEQKLAGAGLEEAEDARKIVRLVNEAIHRTRERARGLVPVVSDAGGLATENDAARLARSGAPVKQITTGTVCHLEAAMIRTALDGRDVGPLDFLFIENVGNLVCPASYDLGENLRLVLMSVTEGEDKPLKYPTIFNSGDVAVVSKIDLEAAVEFDWAAASANIHAVRPGMPILRVSARTGTGMDECVSMLDARLVELRSPAEASAS